MYIRLQGDSHLLITTMKDPDGAVTEVVLADLGQDPELNLFIAAEIGRRKDPELWEGISNFHILQSLENYKRRSGGFKPALVAVKGNRKDVEDELEEDNG
jgi:hypothetical protein